MNQHGILSDSAIKPFLGSSDEVPDCEGDGFCSRLRSAPFFDRTQTGGRLYPLKDQDKCSIHQLSQPLSVLLAPVPAVATDFLSTPYRTASSIYH